MKLLAQDRPQAQRRIEEFLALHYSGLLRKNPMMTLEVKIELLNFIIHHLKKVHLDDVPSEHFKLTNVNLKSSRHDRLEVVIQYEGGNIRKYNQHRLNPFKESRILDLYIIPSQLPHFMRLIRMAQYL